MGLAWRYLDRWNFSGPINQNRDVGWSSFVERYCMLGQRRSVWTDPLLFYGSLFHTPGVCNDTPWIPSREPGGERLDVVRPGHRRRNRFLVGCYGTGMGKVFPYEVLI